MKAKDDLGRRGEEFAAEWLAKSGLRVVARNWRCPVGEIDIVAHDGAVLAIVEVKTRTSDAFGHPFEAITPAKLKRLHLLAAAWVADHPGVRHPDVRVDVVGILWPEFGEPSIHHLKGVC
ncbi:YraN family protein [Herbiconiux sp. UC225_62]|uniref:YraN family protein n=1 Tax=Herbiconiux sp. UC225_62 TaxID=3350168 RepID=UPI0036D303DA